MAPSTGSVTAVALYDRVSYKPQAALDAPDLQGKRITDFFDKGEVREIPSSEFNRLTTGPFAGEPAVRKATKDEATSQTAAAPAEESVAPDGTDMTLLGEGAGRSASQADAGTPRDPTVGTKVAPPAGEKETPTEAAAAAEQTAALDALTVKQLTKLARDNKVPIAPADRKKELVSKLAAAGVTAPTK